ncbi:MAG: transporter substrate-binding domain-containing protein [Arcobacter sp.]|uniref:transporter substrate-binding domain-containing protein n=1 Tax=Arcobacter sp. TaxID=1872629 RepID=UPI003B008F72
MKKIIIYILFLYSLNSIFASDLNFTQEEKEYIKNSPNVTIGTMNSFTPFSFKKDGELVGFTQELIDIISQKSGLKFKKMAASWPEIYDLFYNGKIDIISEVSYRQDRLPFTLYSSPYYVIPIGVFTRKDFGNYNGIKSLRNKKVGVVKNTFIIDILRKENIEIVEFDDSDERFFALDEKKIDVIITNILSIYKLEDLVLPNLKLAGRFVHPDTSSEDLRFGIEKENPILASIINKTLDSIPYSTLSDLKRSWILNLNKSNISLTKEEKKWIDKNRISVGIEPAKPYIYYDSKKNTNNGLYNDILLKVLEKTGLKVEYVHSSWAKLLDEFKNEKIDLLPATFYSKEREEFGLFSDEFYKVREYIYISNKNEKIRNFKDLEGKKVAITKGYATIDKIRKKFPKIKIIETSGLGESTSKVLNGEVDALVDYHLVVENYIRDNSIVGLKDIAQNDLSAVSVHFLSNKSKPTLQRILQKGLDNISREEMNNILRKWVREPYDNDTENQNLLTDNEKEFIIKHQKIRFAVVSNRPPFEFIKDGKASGIAVEYIKKSAENVGLDVEFINNNMPMAKAYKTIETSRDKFDTILFSVKNEQRAKRFSYGSAFLSYPMMIIKHKDSAYIGSMKDLSGKTVAIEENFLTNKWIKRDYPKIKIVNFKDTKDALTNLDEKKVDAYVGNLAVANYLSVFGDLNNIKVAAPSGYGNIEFSFIAPKEWPELASILSKGFNQITPIEHTVIQQRWFSLQTIDRINYSLIWKVVAVSIFIILWILWWNRKIATEKDRTKNALNQLQDAQHKLEHKNIEVNDAKNFLESVLDESPDLIIIKDYEGKFLLVNKAVAKLYRTTINNMIGKYDSDFKHAKQMSDFFNKNIKQIIDNNKTEVSYEDFNKTEHYITTKKPFTNEKGEKLILIIAHDISTIKKLEDEQLKQQQLLLNQSKIAAMGEMLGNISHQWRQPLSVITTQASSIGLLLDVGKKISDEDLLEYSSSIMQQANYLSKTIDDFRNFFTSDSSTKHVYNLKNIFFKLDDLIKIPYSNNFIKTINQIDDDIKLELNENILIQAFINIYNNSKDAFIENNISTDDRYLFLRVTKDKEKVVITFKDSAGGIEKGSMDKIFEPYYTTKHKSVGTGIGLYMSNQIITKHLKGEISATNETYTYNDKTYTGAKFTITLPL